MTTGVGSTLTMGYDGLRRLTSVTGGPVTRQYTYRDIDSTKTTMQVASVTSGGQRYGYTYDSMGNIATYAAPGKGTVTYTYDNQGQLLSAAGDTTYTYTYDGAGNILTASDGTATHSYTYGDTDWKDLLTGFDGQAIIYDAIGNPTSYCNGTRWNFTWVNGRSLTTASDGTNSLSFAYDAGGLRTSKTVGSTTYHYYYAGGKLMRMTWGTNTIDFFYDASGLPYAMKYNGTAYYYITNLQGDVMRIVDANGTVMASYDYDPYGKVLSDTGTLANINPLHYRGYVCDQETGFYYLQSRYYDPAVGRFVNADSYASTGQDVIGHNMFTYCVCNPVNKVDPAGHIAVSMAVAATNSWNPLGWAAMAFWGTVVLGTLVNQHLNSVSSRIAIGNMHSLAIAQSTAKEKEESESQAITAELESQGYQYWEAKRVKNAVVIGQGLTFSEASLRVACGYDIMCANQSGALSIVINNGYWNAVGPEIHGEEGYFWHYHPNRNTHVHIWYY